VQNRQRDSRIVIDGQVLEQLGGKHVSGTNGETSSSGGGGERQTGETEDLGVRVGVTDAWGGKKNGKFYQTRGVQAAFLY